MAMLRFQESSIKSRTSVTSEPKREKNKTTIVHEDMPEHLPSKGFESPGPMRHVLICMQLYVALFIRENTGRNYFCAKM